MIRRLGSLWTRSHPIIPGTIPKTVKKASLVTKIHAAVCRLGVKCGTQRIFYIVDICMYIKENVCKIKLMQIL